MVGLAAGSQAPDPGVWAEQNHGVQFAQGCLRARFARGGFAYIVRPTRPGSVVRVCGRGPRVSLISWAARGIVRWHGLGGDVIR